METCSCYQCGSPNGKTTYVDIDTRCSIARCLSCGAYYTKERFSQSEIANLYEQENYFTERTSASWSDAWLPALYRQVERIRSVTGNKGSLLDVGCGGGGFVYAAKENGWDAWGIDPSHTAISLAKAKWGLDTLFNSDLDHFVQKKDFDVITAWHVLEHLYDPIHALQQMRSLLKPHGLLAVGVPNFGSIDVRLDSQIRLTTMHLPYHIVHFVPTSLTALLQSQGFSIIDTQYSTPATLDRLRSVLRSEKGKKTTNPTNDNTLESTPVVASRPGNPTRLKGWIWSKVTNVFPGSYMEFYAITQ